MIDTQPERRVPQRPGITLPMSQVEQLGTFGGRRFVEIEGTVRELVGPLEDSGHMVQRARAGEVRVTDREVRIFEGTSNTRAITFQALPAATAYKRLSEKADRRKAEMEARQRVRPVDVLGRLPLFGRTPERILDMGGSPDREPLPLSVPASLDTEAASALLRLGRKARALIQPSKPAPRGGAAIVARLEAKGYRLSIAASGRLLVQAKSGFLSDAELTALQLSSRLIVGSLTGHPVLCEFAHNGSAPEAATIVALDVAACEQHAANGSDEPREAA